jgi:hypothetical protein
MRRVLALGLLLASASCGGAAPPSAGLSELNGRSVLAPARFGVLSSKGDTTALPSSVSLGAKTSGRALVYLEFPEPDQARRLLRAQLLLSSSLPAQPVTIEVSRAEPARGALVAWSDQPRALYPRLSAELGGHAGLQRIDVTEILQARSKAGEPLCLLVRAEPAEGEGVLIATGAAGGEAPRLELYWE